MKHWIGIIGVTSALLIALPAVAQERVIRFGTTGDYPPYATWQGDGTLGGADAVVARRIAKAMHARPVFVRTSWTTLAEDFAARRFDVAIGGLTVQPDRAAIGTFSIPLMDDGKRPLALCQHKSRYRTLAQIDNIGTRIQINRGPAIARLAQQWFTKASVTINPDDATLAEWLLQEKADVWITDGVVVDHMARLYPRRLCATTQRPFTHQTKAWLIQNDPPLIAAINKGLAASLRNGEWKSALHTVDPAQTGSSAQAPSR